MALSLPGSRAGSFNTRGGAAAALMMPAIIKSYDLQLERCLADFVRLRTVSGDPRLHEECLKGAKYLSKALESMLGADVKVIPNRDEKNPVVVGRLGWAPDRPTVTFYGHYDVQPAAEPDWATPPFELTAVNEYLYGRGTSDNKGPVLAFIFAVKELLDECELRGEGRLPVNVAFLLEGEEENGSIGFREAVQQSARWFENTAAVVVSNTQWVGEHTPCLTYGMRGMINVSIQVSGPEKDLHSGNDGGVFNEPIQDLLKLLAGLQGSKCDIQVSQSTLYRSDSGLGWPWIGDGDEDDDT